MPQKQINFTLPEFCFLDGNSPDGDTLEGRTLIQHIRSYTIIEAFNRDELPILSQKKEVKIHEFQYKNIVGDTETYILAVHFCLSDEIELPTIFLKAEKWYRAYMDWEDKNIITEETSKLQ